MCSLVWRAEGFSSTACMAACMPAWCFVMFLGMHRCLLGKLVFTPSSVVVAFAQCQQLLLGTVTVCCLCALVSLWFCTAQHLRGMALPAQNRMMAL